MWTIRHASKLLVGSLSALVRAGWSGLGCAYTRTTVLPRSALEQPWRPKRSTASCEARLAGRRRQVARGPAPSAGGVLDRDYLLRSVEIEVAQRGGGGGRRNQPGYELKVLVGAAGVDQSGRFFGVRGTQAGGMIPFTIPELGIDKTQRRNGLTKLALALLDQRSGGVVHCSGPELGARHVRTRTLFRVPPSAGCATTASACPKRSRPSTTSSSAPCWGRSRSRCDRTGGSEVVISANDFLVTAEDVEWLGELLGDENVHIDERGGHMGNLWEPAVKDAVLRALNDLVGRVPSSTALH